LTIDDIEIDHLFRKQPTRKNNKKSGKKDNKVEDNDSMNNKGIDPDKGK